MWNIHTKIQTDHEWICARCRLSSPEMGVVEAHTTLGWGYWQLCGACVAAFIQFITKQEATMNDWDFFTELYTDDIDIAAHHEACECQECLVDGDAQRKFMLENDHDFFESVYKTA